MPRPRKSIVISIDKIFPKNGAVYKQNEIPFKLPMVILLPSNIVAIKWYYGNVKFELRVHSQLFKALGSTVLKTDIQIYICKTIH